MQIHASAESGGRSQSQHSQFGRSSSTASSCQCGESLFQAVFRVAGLVGPLGAGTPEVLEFAPAVLGARLQTSTGAVHSLMADALGIAHRLPSLWRRVQALEVKASYARFVARRTRDLGLEQAAYVDKRVHQAADGRIPWTRFEALVEGAIAASDPAAAAERERDAAMRQLAKPTRSTDAGMRGFYVRAPLHVIARLDAMVTLLARIHPQRHARLRSRRPGTRRRL